MTYKKILSTQARLDYYKEHFLRELTLEKIFELQKKAKEPEYFLAAILENNNLLVYIKYYTDINLQKMHVLSF